MVGLLPALRSTIVEQSTTQATLIMDANVLAAMARWPDVPDVYGWLSLTENGQWRLHPRGDAWPSDAQGWDAAVTADDGSLASGADTAGESITSPQILQFINRNYANDELGQWFFQNGPQKVYVRLDAAPYILQTTSDNADDTLCLRTHDGLDIKSITGWILDETGKLYAQTEHGPGLVAGRDLASVLNGIHTPEGIAILDVLEQTPLLDGAIAVQAQNLPSTVLFKACTAKAVPQALGFVRYPRALPASQPNP